MPGCSYHVLMSDPTDPPRPSLRQTVRDFIAESCTWDEEEGRLETTSGGDPVVAWLNQTGTPTKKATVQWEAGKTADADSAVPATITKSTFDIIKNGSWDSQSGLVTYASKSYRFRFAVVSGEAHMEPYAE